MPKCRRSSRHIPRFVGARSRPRRLVPKQPTLGELQSRDAGKEQSGEPRNFACYQAVVAPGARWDWQMKAPGKALDALTTANTGPATKSRRIPLVAASAVSFLLFKFRDLRFAAPFGSGYGRQADESGAH